MLRLVGAIFVAFGGWMVGHVRSTASRRSLNMIEQLLDALELMICELEYRQIPLPELCASAAERTSGPVSVFFKKMEIALKTQLESSVHACGKKVLEDCDALEDPAKKYIILLLASLGRFDLTGQITEIQRVRDYAQSAYLDARKHLMQNEKSNRLLWLGLGTTIAVILV